MSIFVSVAAYKEIELAQTIQSAIDNSDNPQALHFGVFQQDVDVCVLESSTAKITNRWVHHSQAKGAGWARAKAQELYAGEKYFLQIDAHSIFTPHWDTRLITWLDVLPAKKPIVSAWPMPYTYRNGEIVLDAHEKGEWSVQEPHKTVAMPYGRSWVGARRSLEGALHAVSHVGLGGLWFCDAKFIKEVPYDPRIAWYGEEFLLSVRAFNKGWTIFGINDVILYHNYERHGRPRVWDRNRKWNAIVQEAVGIQSDILNFKDHTKYRLKNKKALQEYIDMTGLTTLQMDAFKAAKRVGARHKL